jgi:Family of unknown function (DUF5681)
VSEDNDSSYPVGYRKPPKHSQFKPGKSGNPNGRPRKSTTLDDDIEKQLCTKVPLTGRSTGQKMTKRQIVAMQFVNKAASGDTRSIELLLRRTEKARSDQENSVEALVQEFRERSRLLEIAKSVQEKPVVSSPSSAPSNATIGEDS